MTDSIRRARVLAPAKINLCLRIVGRRADGYHLLDSAMVPVSVFDRIALSMSPAQGIDIAGQVRGAELPIDDGNLIVRAARVFFERTRRGATLRFDLDKQIPIGAGMGGGSSDAAAVLLALDGMCGTELDTAQLIEWGAELGADVPFFIVGRPARIQGIGEVVSPLDLPSQRPAIIVAFPGVGLATAAVYRAYDASLTSPKKLSSQSLFAFGQGPLERCLVNDLEAAAFQLHPPLEALKDRLVQLGAAGALMTGSGSAIFGMWDRHDRAVAAVEELKSTDKLWARVVQILDRAPRPEVVEKGN